MSRPFYSEYVRHALRYYARNYSTSVEGHPPFKTDVDKCNWMSCHSVIQKYPLKEKNILVSVYGGFDTLADEVYGVSKRYSINQNEIWDLMKDAEKRIATRRGLI